MRTKLLVRSCNYTRDHLKTLQINIVSKFNPNFLLWLKRKEVIFSLDLHTSVVRDLIPSFSKFDIRAIRWSISSGSYLFKEANLRLKHINNQNWKSLSEQNVELFWKKYRYLPSIADFFAIGYVLSFILLFEGFNKPIFAVNATRYEAPFTNNEDGFKKLNSVLIEKSRSGILTVVSNNAGDAAYLEYFTGIKSDVVPNLCDYVAPYSPSTDNWIVLCRNRDLVSEVLSLNSNFKLEGELFPNGYSFNDLAKQQGVILFPYNISTMRLFELSAAGIPVRIPTDRFLLELKNLPGILSELSWIQVENQDCPKWLANTPADPNWSDFYDFWLPRADWQQEELFPNISRFDSFSELNEPVAIVPPLDIQERNKKIRTLWDEQIGKFLNK